MNYLFVTNCLFHVSVQTLQSVINICKHTKLKYIKKAIKNHNVLSKRAHYNCQDLKKLTNDCIKYDDLDYLELLISKDLRTDLYLWQYSYDYPLNVAIQSNKLDIVKMLRKADANYTATSFGYAVKTGNLELVKYLHEDKCKLPYLIGMHDAILEGYLDIVEYFVSYGIYIKPYMLRYATENRHLHMIKYILSKSYRQDFDQSSLTAVEKGDIDIVRCLIGNLEHKVSNDELE